MSATSFLLALRFSSQLTPLLTLHLLIVCPTAYLYAVQWRQQFPFRIVRVELIYVYIIRGLEIRDWVSPRPRPVSFLMSGFETTVVDTDLRYLRGIGYAHLHKTTALNSMLFHVC